MSLCVPEALSLLGEGREGSELCPADRGPERGPTFL